MGISEEGLSAAGTDVPMDVVPVVRESFDAFFAAEHTRLFKTMVLLSGDPAVADDLTQEAFVRVLERWDEVAAMEQPVAYLYRIAINQHRSGLRRALRWRRRALVERPSEDASEAAIARAMVHGALRSLSAEQRIALVLTDWAGLSAEEAGKVLGIEAGAVRGRVHRARGKLREELITDG